MSEKQKVKPRVKLIGTDGNVFALMGKCTQALRKAGQAKEADQITEKIFNCGSYQEALTIMQEFVEVE